VGLPPHATGELNRFVVEPADIAGDVFPVPPLIAHQLSRVLRLRDGDEVILLDGTGSEARCRLTRGATMLEVLERGPSGGEPRHRLTVWQALLKGDGIERVVQQGTELGVATFRLITTDRVVAREISARRLERLRAIARESTEQSERGKVPSVEAPVPFERSLEPGAVLLFERAGVAHPGLGQIDPPPSVIIGPEGGFTPDEVAAAEHAGVRLAGLGPRILRAESVAIAATAVILSRSGDFA
jgi:16S rRNA (uracil1498-N3)-methyltransferase